MNFLKGIVKGTIVFLLSIVLTMLPYFFGETGAAILLAIVFFLTVIGFSF